MATRQTQWSPDTCDCVVRYEWDDAISEQSRTHAFHSFAKKCSTHGGMSDADAWAALTEENPRKNKLLGRAKELFPSQFDAQGHFLGQWFFDDSRVLHVVTNPTLGPAQLSQIQTWCDTNLGPGRVIVS